MSPGHPRTPHAARALALVFSVCFAGYLLNLRALTEADCVPAPYTAWALVDSASFDVGGYPYLETFHGGVVVELDDGSWVSRYPPGSSLAAVPFVAPLALVLDEPLGSGAMRRVGKLTASVCVALAAAFFFAVARRLAPAGAVAGTLLFAFGTSAWSVASQALWMHGPALLWLCLALWLLAGRERSRGRDALAGAAHGLAVLTRPTTALFAAASLAALLWRRDLAGALRVGIGTAVGAGLLLLYNAVHFGAPVAGGYGAEAGRWSTPLAVGLFGLLASPSRGLLVYSPALLLAPLGVRWLRRSRSERVGHLGERERALLAGWSLAGVATVVLYAKWHAWWGGWSYGPRLLAESLPIWCLLFSLAYARAGRALRVVARVGIALSVAVHFLGVFGDNTEWLKRHPEGEPDFSLRDTQIESHFRALFGLPPAREPSR